MLEKMDKETLMEVANKIIDRDDNVRIATLGDELTISQVIKFFARQGRSFTKTMIQNYVRVGVLPPPLEKRYYTRNHLVMLTLIDNLKAVYSLEEIKNVLEPVRNNPQIFEDDMINTDDIYNNYLAIRKETLSNWSRSLPALFDGVDRLLGQDRISDTERGTASAFLVTLAVMTETIAMRDLANEIIKKFINKN